MGRSDAGGTVSMKIIFSITIRNGENRFMMDIRLFEKICLEGFQSGLSWLTILRKRENFRKAFKGFDFKKVARFTENDVERLLLDAGIVRHRRKIESTINNAKKALELKKEFWFFVRLFLAIQTCCFRTTEGDEPCQSFQAGPHPYFNSTK